VIFSYYSDLFFPSSSVATRQVCKTVDALQCGGHEAHLYLPRPWRYGLNSAQRRLNRLRSYYGLSDSFRIDEWPSPVPLVGKIQRFPFTRLALSRIARREYGLLCVRNYWHLKMGLSRGMQTMYETYKYLGEPERTAKIIELLKKSPHFVGLILHSDLARQHWLSLGADPERTVTIHNGMDADGIASHAYAGREEARARLNMSADEKVVIYTGNMGVAKGIESLLDLASQLPEFTFLLVGCRKRSDRRRLLRRAQELRLGNVILKDWLAPVEIGALQRAADALIIPPTAGPLRSAGKTVLPIKTFEYLAAGIPLLAPRLEDTAELLTHEHNAFLLEPDNPAENATAIRRLWHDEALRRRMVDEALILSSELTWQRRAERLADFAARVSRKPGDPC
jgi:glycosyltransferase involved in cell wall biosynthesis